MRCLTLVGKAAGEPPQGEVGVREIAGDRRGWGGAAALTLWLLASAGLHAQQPAAAAEACGTEGTPTAQAVCASPELAEASAQMAAAMKQLLEGLPASAAAEVRADQAQWGAWVQAVCRAESGRPPTDLAACLTDPVHDRGVLLRRGKVTEAGVLFVTRSQSLYRADRSDDPPGTQYPGFGEVRVSWPEAQSAAPEWVAWNRAVELAVKRLVAPSDAEARQWSNDWARAEDVEVTVTAPQVVGGRVSVGIGEDYDAHGTPHGNEHGYYFHWLLGDAREITPEDVFRAGAKWEAALVKACVAAVHEQLGDGFDYSEAGPIVPAVRGVVRQPRNWKFTGRGLVVVFPVLSVAPEARPVDDVLVPWKRLRPDLAESFVLPEPPPEEPPPPRTEDTPPDQTPSAQP